CVRIGRVRRARRGALARLRALVHRWALDRLSLLIAAHAFLVEEAFLSRRVVELHAPDLLGGPIVAEVLRRGFVRALPRLDADDLSLLERAFARELAVLVETTKLSVR